jgi:hypothetical protein
MLLRLCHIGLVFLITFFLSACSPYVEYQPFLLPVKLMVSPNGTEIAGETSIITPIGEFTIGASSTSAPVGPINVIIRDPNKGTKSVYSVSSVQPHTFTVVIDGKTKIEVGSDRNVIVTILEGRVLTIEFLVSPPPRSKNIAPAIAFFSFVPPHGLFNPAFWLAIGTAVLATTPYRIIASILKIELEENSIPLMIVSGIALIYVLSWNGGALTNYSITMVLKQHLLVFHYNGS